MAFFIHLKLLQMLLAGASKLQTLLQTSSKQQDKLSNHIGPAANYIGKERLLLIIVWDYTCYISS